MSAWLNDFQEKQAHELSFLCRLPVLQALLWAPSPGSDFYALPLPWGALQWRAYACPAWRVMSIAPAGSSSNSVHKKNQDKPLTLSSRRNWGQGRGVGGIEPELSDSISLSLFLSLSLPDYLSISVFSQVFFFSFQFSYYLLNRAQS